MFECSRCLKLFGTKQNYTRHMNRKRQCKKNDHDNNASRESFIDDFTCQYCHKSFYKKYNLERHLKNSFLGCFHQIKRETATNEIKMISNNKSNQTIVQNINPKLDKINPKINKFNPKFVDGYTKKQVAFDQAWKCHECKNMLTALYELACIMEPNKMTNIHALCYNCYEGDIYNDATKRKKLQVAFNQEWKCNKCKNILPASYEVDHKIKKSHGGKNIFSNLQALCNNCHADKTWRENMTIII